MLNEQSVEAVQLPVVDRRFAQLSRQFDSLKPPAQKIFLAGVVLFPEAKEFSEIPGAQRGQRKYRRTLIKRSHETRHVLILSRISDKDPIMTQKITARMTAPVKTIIEFGNELDAMPPPVATAVYKHQITLIQARYAVHKNLDERGMLELCRINAPKPPKRERPRRPTNLVPHLR